MRIRTVTIGAAATLAAALLAVPAVAAVPNYNGTVGPGFTISLAKKPTKAGKVKLTVNDKSNIHNFRLKGPGVNVATTVPSKGVKSFTVTLKKGSYTFVCDPHASSMKGSFKIT
jgi:plastocyanin